MDNFLMEEWKDIQGFIGYYQISNFGRVRSLDRKVFYSGRKNPAIFKGKMLQPVINKVNGYEQIILYKNTKYKSFYVHRLVAQAFIEEVEGKDEVNHIDENKCNNHVGNLEWVTRKENNNFGTKNERSSLTQSFGSRGVIGTNKITGEVLYFRNSLQAEKQGGFCHSHIAKVCRGKQKTHKGYFWEYSLEDYSYRS